MTMNFECDDELNKKIIELAKYQDMKKYEWVRWALAEMVRQVTAVKEKIEARTPEEIEAILKAREAVMSVPDDIRKQPMFNVDDFEINDAQKALLKEKHDELIVFGETKVTDKELISTLNDHPRNMSKGESMPTYTFYLTAGGEKVIQAIDIDEALLQSGLGEDDYLDFKVQ